MKATVYILSPSLHLYISETFENVDTELIQDLQAYAEYYHEQVRVEYS